MNSPKGQVGVEYLVISGFLLFAVLVFFAFSISTYNESASFTKAKNLVDSLANTASQLSGLGNNSSLTLDLDFPDSIQSFEVSGKTLRLFLNSSTGLREYYAESKLDLNSVNLPLTPGMHRVKVFVSESKAGFVEVQ